MRTICPKDRPTSLLTKKETESPFVPHTNPIESELVIPPLPFKSVFYTVNFVSKTAGTLFSSQSLKQPSTIQLLFNLIIIREQHGIGRRGEVMCQIKAYGITDTPWIFRYSG